MEDREVGRARLPLAKMDPCGVQPWCKVPTWQVKKSCSKFQIWQDGKLRKLKQIPRLKQTKQLRYPKQKSQRWPGEWVLQLPWTHAEWRHWETWTQRRHLGPLFSEPWWEHEIKTHNSIVRKDLDLPARSWVKVKSYPMEIQNKPNVLNVLWDPSFVATRFKSSWGTKFMHSSVPCWQYPSVWAQDKSKIT